MISTVLASRICDLQNYSSSARLSSSWAVSCLSTRLFHPSFSPPTRPPISDIAVSTANIRSALLDRIPPMARSGDDHSNWLISPSHFAFLDGSTCERSKRRSPFALPRWHRGGLLLPAASFHNVARYWSLVSLAWLPSFSTFCFPKEGIPFFIFNCQGSGGLTFCNATGGMRL